MKKFAGILIIIISLFLSIGNALAYRYDLIVAFIFFVLISLPVYIIGQIVRTSLVEFKSRGKRWIGIYLFFLFILPLLINSYIYVDEYKLQTFADEHFIIFEPASGELGKLSIGIQLVLIFLFAARLLQPDIQRKWTLNISIIVTSLVFLGFHYVMFSDYRGVHEEKGLVTSTWTGEKSVVSYHDIESITLVPSVHYASLSNTSDETRFVWKIIFRHEPENGEVVYQYNMISKNNLEETIAIKEVASQHNVPFMVKEMNPKTFKWFEFDLGLEELDQDRYYELFKVVKLK
jgi:hypothetical protein